MSEFGRELVVGLRQLRHSLGAVASLTVGTGLSIGASLAVCAQLYGTLAPDSPIPDPARLFVVENSGGYSLRADSSYDPRVSRPDLDVLAQQQHAFKGFAGLYSGAVAVMAGADRPRSVCRIFVLPQTLETFGVPPVLGRWFGAADFEAGAPGVALLTGAVWRQYFGRDPSVAGRRIQLDEQPFSIAGVMPDHVVESLQPLRELFATGRRHLCVITPLTPGNSGEAERVLAYLRVQPDAPGLLVIGRLRDDVSFDAAKGEMSGISETLRQLNPSRPASWRLRLVPLRAWQTVAVQPLLSMVAVAAALMLLVASANSAGLLMAESVKRAPELAVRVALGAGPRDLMLVVLLRSMLWSIPGGLLGLVIANAALGFTSWNGILQREFTDALLAGVLAGSVLLTLIVALMSGGMAAWALRHQGLSQSLRETGQATGVPERSRAAMLLLSLQVAAAVALVIGAGLLLRSLWTIGTADYGFDRAHGFVIEIRLPRSRYPTTREQVEYYERVLSRVRGVQGVAAAGFSSSPPLSDAAGSIAGVAVETTADTRRVQSLNAHFVTSGYFEALGLRLVRGRFLSARDERDGTAVVVDEAFRRRFLDDTDPLASVLRFGSDRLSIVGVVGDTRQSIDAEGLADAEAEAGVVYLTFSRFTSAPTWRFLVVRTLSRQGDVAAAAIGELSSLDGSVLLGDPATFDDLLSTKTTGQRRLSVLLGLMGAIVLLLTAASITAALSQLVTMRSREIAIRYCLGARPREIVVLTARRLGSALGVGLVLGAGGGILLGHVLGSRLYGIRPTDGWTFAFVLALLASVGTLAAAGPLLRAARIDPARAIREA